MKIKDGYITLIGDYCYNVPSENFYVSTDGDKYPFLIDPEETMYTDIFTDENT